MNWKRLIIGLGVLAVMSSKAGGAPSVLPPVITARAAVQKMAKGFNLGQMFESQQHPAAMSAAKPKIDAYYARGFRVVRIPVTWTETIGGSTLADPETGRLDGSNSRLRQLTAVIDYALSKPNMYVILNAHHETRLKEDNRAAAFERLWGDINDEFLGRSRRLIFELLNEPHLANRDPMPAANLRAMTARAYSRIRAADPTRLLVIGGNQWFAADEMAKVWPDLRGVGDGNDAFLMATFHHYGPWTFAGDNQGDYSDAWTDNDIDTPTIAMMKWSGSMAKNIPFYIGEWGVGWKSRYPEMKCNNIRKYYTDFNSRAASKNIPAIVWDDGGWFQLFDHATKSFSNNLIDCIGGSCPWDGEQRFNMGCS